MIRKSEFNAGLEGSGFLLSSLETKMIFDSIDFLLRDEMRAANKRKEDAEKPKNNITAIFNNMPLVNAFFDKIKDDFQEIAEHGNSYQQTISFWIVNNFETVLKYYFKNSKFLKSYLPVKNFGIDNNIIENSESSESAKRKYQETTKSNNQPGNNKSIEEYASDEVKYLIFGLSAKTQNGLEILNELGLPNLVDFKVTFNRIVKCLQGKLSEKSMYETLVEKSQEYPEFIQLYQELGDPSDYETNNNKFNLWMKFRQAFSMTRIPIMVYHQHIDQQGKYHFNLYENRPDLHTIKNQFSNNFKTQVGLPYTTINPKGMNTLNFNKLIGNIITIASDKKGPFPLIKNDKRIDFLKALGIVFDNKWQIKESINEFDKIHYLIQKLYDLNIYSIEITDPINQISDDTLDRFGKIILKGESNNIKTLLELQAKYSDSECNYQVIFQSNNKAWTHSKQNMISIQNSLINDAEAYPTYYDVIALPEFTSKLDVTKNPLIASSLMLHSLFDLETGKRRLNDDGTHVTISLVNISSIKIVDEDKDIGIASEGTKISGLSRQGNYLLNMNGMLQAGIAETLRHAEKSYYYGVKLSTINNGTKTGFKDLNFPVINFSGSVIYGEKISFKVTDYLKRALLGELTLIGRLNSEIGADIQGYKENAKQLFTFDGVLNNKLKDKLIELIKHGVPADLEQQMNQFDKAIISDLKTYFENLEAENWKMFRKNPAIGEDILNKVQTYLKPTQNPNTTHLQKQQILNRTYTYNSWIALMEEHKFYYGDLFSYRLDKKQVESIEGAYITKTTLCLTSGSIKYIKDKCRLVAESLGYPEKKFDGTFQLRIYNDLKIKSGYYDRLLSTYTEYYNATCQEYSDIKINQIVKGSLLPFTDEDTIQPYAEGFITLDSWRILKMLQGKWNVNMERTYEKAAVGIELTGEELFTFFYASKTHYCGPLKTNQFDIFFSQEFLMIPLIPFLIKEDNMEEINSTMLAEGSDFFIFKSGINPNTVFSNDSSTYVRHTLFARYLGEL